MNKSKSNNKSVWSDVPKRLLTIFLGIPFVYKLLSNPITSYVFFMGAHILSAWEYTLLEPQLSVSTSTSSSVSGHRRRRILFCIISVLLACIPDSNNNNQSSNTNTNTFNLFIFILSLMGCIYVILDNNSSNNSNSSYTSGIANHYIIGLLFITIPFRAWCNLAISSSTSMQTTSDESSSSSSSFASTISVLLIVWNTDTGALIVGRLLGRRNKKINDTKNNNSSNSNVPEWIQKISPAKTMEGFLGGIFGGIITSIWLIPFLLNSLSIIDCNNIDIDDTDTTSFCILWGGSTSSSILLKRFLIGLSLALFAIVGDLVESAIKRKSKTKDSGSILPGHGGILDRFDSSLIAILFYRYIVCVYFISSTSNSTDNNGNDDGNEL